MDILSLVGTVVRRWYVTVPIVLAALGVAFYVNSNIPPEYQAEGQVLLASPDLDPAGLPRAVVNLGEVAGEAATEQARGEMIEGGAELVITATVATLEIDVTGPAADVVEGTYTNAVRWLSDTIARRQDDAGINLEEQLILQQDGGAEVREREVGGFALTGRLELVDPAAGRPNPFGANNPTARILIVAIQSDAGRSAVAELTGPEVDFTVGQDARDAAPIIGITTVGADPVRVIEAYDHVADVLEAELGTREERAEVPESRRTRIERIATPESVSDISPPLDRSVAAIIGLGGMLAVIVAVALESLAARKRNRLGALEAVESRTSSPHAGEPEEEPLSVPEPAPTAPPLDRSPWTDDAPISDYFATGSSSGTEREDR